VHTPCTHQATSDVFPLEAHAQQLGAQSVFDVQGSPALAPPVRTTGMAGQMLLEFSAVGNDVLASG
jgi:hypothetical protein